MILMEYLKTTTVHNFSAQKETCDKLPFVLQLSGEIQEDLTYKLDARCELIETYKFASAVSQIVFTYPKHAHNIYINFI